MKMIDIKYVLIFVFLILIDQLSKYLFFNKELFNEFFLISKVFNNGIAFGFDLNIYFVLIISFLSLVFFLRLYIRKILTISIIVLLLAGTIGNLIDRVFFGGVRDFIDLHYWPVFNFADSFLTLAIIFLLYDEFFKKNLDSKE